MSKPHIAYVTYINDPADSDPDFDRDIFIGALVDHGMSAVSEVWNDPQVDWKAYDMAIIRSTWDYARQRGAFLAWAKSVAAVTRLVNPYEVIKDNTDKTYLRAISSAGIPVIPTLYLKGPNDLRECCFAADEWVVKPTVDAGARGASRHMEWKGVEERVRAHFAESSVPLMLQPYLPEVDSAGEIAVICCRGELLHAVVKKPALSQGGHGDFAGRAVITPSLRTFVENVLALPTAHGTYADLLYVRVDIVPRNGGFVLMELEATEPNLFLSSCKKSVHAFARAVKELFELTPPQTR